MVQRSRLAPTVSFDRISDFRRSLFGFWPRAFHIGNMDRDGSVRLLLRFDAARAESSCGRECWPGCARTRPGDLFLCHKRSHSGRQFDYRTIMEAFWCSDSVLRFGGDGANCGRTAAWGECESGRSTESFVRRALVHVLERESLLAAAVTSELAILSNLLLPKFIHHRKISICAPTPAHVSSTTSCHLPVREGIKLWCHSSRLATIAVPRAAMVAQRTVHLASAGKVSRQARKS